MSDHLLDIEVVFEDEDPLEVAERATLLPDFDLVRYAEEAMVDDDPDEPTLEVPEAKLTALVSKSVPPTCVVGIDQFVCVTMPPTELASRPFSVTATHLISLIDGKTPLAVVVMNSGLTHVEAMGALRELYGESAISMVA